ncbi:hypothetical protein PN499_04570 [Kamptonema animale CS-326]|uniref:hypothetical protein n=1 Tax=Kamptonema animale TaxID=92934 RepID=UPI00232FF379|nr:hypothetical protein [Kamptonema animale]MDB9510454.1 hypothetical protein [Kamptonema animale CS-326]
MTCIPSIKALVAWRSLQLQSRDSNRTIVGANPSQDFDQLDSAAIATGKSIVTSFHR